GSGGPGVGGRLAPRRAARAGADRAPGPRGGRRARRVARRRGQGVDVVLGPERATRHAAEAPRRPRGRAVAMGGADLDGSGVRPPVRGRHLRGPPRPDRGARVPGGRRSRAGPCARGDRPAPRAPPRPRVPPAPLPPTAAPAFRVDVARGPAPALEVIGRLAGLAHDPAFVGYPYPLARAHQAARVTGYDVVDFRRAFREALSRAGVAERD